jgi:8-oxo-dGTP pyrophosphatase MutT (NUDIX family)
MHRAKLLEMLDRYESEHGVEDGAVTRIRSLVRGHADCFARTCLPGHVTASAWIVSNDRRRVLLTHHRKLGRWLQLGGHADGDPDPLSVVLREAREESGIATFEVVGRAGSAALPIDVDVHLIPARGAEPEHEHHDIRFLLIAGEDRIVTSAESHEIRWFTPAEALRMTDEPGIRRMAAKGFALLLGQGA